MFLNEIDVFPEKNFWCGVIFGMLYGLRIRNIMVTEDKYLGFQKRSEQKKAEKKIKYTL